MYSIADLSEAWKAVLMRLPRSSNRGLDFIPFALGVHYKSDHSEF
jgi:hypothetical protein